MINILEFEDRATRAARLQILIAEIAHTKDPLVNIEHYQDAAFYLMNHKPVPRIYVDRGVDLKILQNAHRKAKAIQNRRRG